MYYECIVMLVLTNSPGSELTSLNKVQEKKKSSFYFTPATYNFLSHPFVLVGKFEKPSLVTFSALFSKRFLSSIFSRMSFFSPKEAKVPF